MAKLTEGSDWLALSCDFIPKSVILLAGMGCSKWLGLECVTSPGFGGQLDNYRITQSENRRFMAPQRNSQKMKAVFQLICQVQMSQCLSKIHFRNKEEKASIYMYNLSMQG